MKSALGASRLIDSLFGSVVFLFFFRFSFFVNFATKGTYQSESHSPGVSVSAPSICCSSTELLLL